MRYAVLFIMALAVLSATAQKKVVSLGLGLNASGYCHVTNSDIYAPGALPGWPFTPSLNLKINRSEFIGGVDLYPLMPTSAGNKIGFITGGQFAYRYHFLREHKKVNLFIESLFQYVQYQDGGLSPKTYNDAYSVGFDGASYKNRSFVNTYGAGLQISFSKRFSLSTVIGGGYNYYQTTSDNAYDLYRLKLGTFIKPMAYFKTGLCYNFVVRKKNACDSCPH